MKTAIAVAAAACLCACRSTESASSPPLAAAEPSERALASLSEAREALREWRTQLGADGKIESAFFQEIKEATQELGVEIQALSMLARGDAPMSAKRASSAPPAIPGSARERSAAWIEDVRAIGDGAAGRRERSLAQVRDALLGSDADAQIAALMTLQSVGDVQYDKASFRPLVLPFAQVSVGAAIHPALYALANTEREPADLALVHAAWERDPSAMHDSVLHLMTMFGAGALEGRSEEIALEWLAKYEGGNRGINGMWGARVGPALEARMIELARSENHEIRHAAIYFGLSTFQEKSAAVCDELIATLTDPDHNNWGRALWGLGHGVPQAQQPRVVEALIELHGARSDRSTRERCERIVTQYGGEEAAARLAR